MKSVFREKEFKHTDGLQGTGDFTIPYQMRTIIFTEKHTEYNTSIVFNNI